MRESRARLVAPTFLILRIVFEIKDPLFKLARYRNDLSSTVRLDPVVDLGQPLAAFTDKVLLRQVDNVDDRLCSD